MKKTFDEVTRVLTWTFSGTNAPKAVQFQVPDLSEWNEWYGSGAPVVYKTMDAALINGYAQKIGDAGALARSKETGKTTTDQDKAAAMQVVVDRLVLEGEWNASKAGGKVKVINVDALVAAMVSVRGKNPERIRAYVQGCDEDKRKALAGSDQFAEAYVVALAGQRPVSVLDEEVDAEIDAIE